MKNLSPQPSIASKSDLITVDELTMWLTKTTLVRRRAILFALETGLSVEAIIGLTWKNFSPSTVSEFARRLTEAMPRHIKLGYVFWEVIPDTGVVAPMFGLRETMQEITGGLTYPELQHLYQSMIWIDRESDCIDFTRDLCTEYSARVG